MATILQHADPSQLLASFFKVVQRAVALDPSLKEGHAQAGGVVFGPDVALGQKRRCHSREKSLRAAIGGLGTLLFLVL